MIVAKKLLPITIVATVAILVFTTITAQSALLPGRDGVLIGKFDTKKKTVRAFNRKLLRLTFQDGTPINKVGIERIGDRFYLIRRGMRKNNSLLTATELVKGSGGALYLKSNAKTEECAGDPCSLCGFKASGGCQCSGTGKCNHKVIVTSLADFLSRSKTTVPFIKG